jgi:probable rRNA maturation factor
LISIRIANRQKAVHLDRVRVRQTIRAILADAGIQQAAISVAVVDDPAIAALHEQFLDDPSPTDVLSFVLEQTPETLEGEVVASADTAAASAPRYHSTPEEELLLYIVHGTLHLVGFDDVTPPLRKRMRAAERKYAGL